MAIRWFWKYWYKIRNLFFKSSFEIGFVDSKDIIERKYSVGCKVRLDVIGSQDTQKNLHKTSSRHHICGPIDPILGLHPNLHASFSFASFSFASFSFASFSVASFLFASFFFFSKKNMSYDIAQVMVWVIALFIAYPILMI